MKNLFINTTLIYILFINSLSISAESVKSKINQLSDKAAIAISDYAENFDSIKYLDLDIQIQNKLKPTFSIMSVTELLKIKSGTIFNQTSLNTHDSDETINIGLGVRKLLNDNKVIIGSNIFYDYQFTEGHSRAGAGVEAISSIFDIRGNYYNAINETQTMEDGSSERALDGWDTQLDYHLPGEHDVNIFANAFEFKNPDKVTTYREKGNKYGAIAKLGNFMIEGGYLDSNKSNDGYFGSIKYVIKLGEQSNKKRNFLEFVDVSDKLYIPVKRENKIRVVKISKSGVEVSGF